MIQYGGHGKTVFHFRHPAQPDHLAGVIGKTVYHLAYFTSPVVLFHYIGEACDLMGQQPGDFRIW